MTTAARPQAVFILSKFPCYDEVFILRELYALSKEMDFIIFSLKKPKDRVVHAEAEELMPRVVYVPYLFSWRILRAQWKVFWRFPRRYALALVKHILGNLRSPEFLVKGLVFFPKAVYLAQLIKERHVPLMHACWATYPASVAMMASEITKVPFSMTGHAHDIYMDTTHLKEKINRAAFVSTCTESNKDYLMKIAPDCPGERIAVIRHGLELHRFSAPEKKGNSVFEILTVGTLHFYKGFNYLVDAAGILKKRGFKFHVTIVGGGALEQDLARHIRLFGLEDSVTMTGPLKQTEVIPYFRKTDVMVLMAQSRWHCGIPNVLIEALAANAAVITTRFGSVEELIRDGETGLIIPAQDPAALADAIEKLCRDETLRLRLANAGHRFVTESFDLSKNIHAFRERLVQSARATQVP